MIYERLPHSKHFADLLNCEVLLNPKDRDPCSEVKRKCAHTVSERAGQVGEKDEATKS